MSWINVAPASEFPEGESRVYEFGGSLWIAFCRFEGRIHAVEDICPHDTGPLGDGLLEGPEIICPRHGARFDIRSGKVLCPPAICDIRTFPTREVEGRVQVELP